MPLQKKTLNIPFSQGLDTKTDPWQVQPGKLLQLENAIFEKQGLLKKRNGFPQIQTLPDINCDTVTTFKNNLIAFGEKFYGLDTKSNAWIDYGSLKSVELKAIPLVRRATSQTKQNTVVAQNGIACTVWSDTYGNSYYQLSDSETGQILKSQVQIDTTSGNVNVIATSQNFVIAYTKFTGTNDILAIKIGFSSPFVSSTPTALTNTLANISNQFAIIKSEIFPQNFILSYINSSNEIIISQHNTFLSLINQNLIASAPSTTYSFLNLYCYTESTGSTTGALIGLLYFETNASSDIVRLALFDSNLNLIANNSLYSIPTGATNFISAGFSIVPSGAKVIFCYTIGLYGGLGSALGNTTEQSKTVKISVVWNSSYTITSNILSELKSSLCLASSLFVYNGITYFIGAYDLYNQTLTQSVSQQPTLFLIDENGVVVSKFAALNSAWNVGTKTLPTVSNIDSNFYCGYLIKTVISSFRNNPDTAITTVNNGGFYSETGINLVKFNFNKVSIDTSEIGNNLHLIGGIVKAFDGANITEQNFNLFPEQCSVITNAFGVSITNANPAVISISSGIPQIFNANDEVRFETSGSLPSPLVVGTSYFVKTILSTTPLSFTISSTIGGVAIATTTTGSGVHTIIGVGEITTTNAPYYFQSIYSYTDAQGNQINSGTSPSFPVGGFTPTKNNCSVTIFVPKNMAH